MTENRPPAGPPRPCSTARRRPAAGKIRPLSVTRPPRARTPVSDALARTVKRPSDWLSGLRLRNRGVRKNSVPLRVRGKTGRPRGGGRRGARDRPGAPPPAPRPPDGRRGGGEAKKPQRD